MTRQTIFNFLKRKAHRTDSLLCITSTSMHDTWYLVRFTKPFADGVDKIEKNVGISKVSLDMTADDATASGRVECCCGESICYIHGYKCLPLRVLPIGQHKRL